MIIATNFRKERLQLSEQTKTNAHERDINGLKHVESYRYSRPFFLTRFMINPVLSFHQFVNNYSLWSVQEIFQKSLLLAHLGPDYCL